MNTIPVSLTEKQFEEYVRSFLSKAKRGFVRKIPLYKVFNHILYRLHTSCQWDQITIGPDLGEPEKKKSAGMRYITNFCQTFQRTNPIASKLNQDRNACSIRLCTKDALRQRASLLGLVSFKLCLFGIITLVSTSYLGAT